MPRTVTPRGFSISDDLYQRARIAAASMGMSTSEYIRRALVCVLQADAMSDAVLAAQFRRMDESVSQRETVPA